MKWVKRILITLLIIAAIIYGLTKYLNVNPPNLVYNSFKGKLPLNQLKLPVGFVIDMYAENVKNARSLCLAPEGTLFVGTRSEGKVYAIKDFNNDHKADTIFVILKDGNMPNGVAFKDGTLYIAEVNRILAFDNILNKLSNPAEPRIVYDKYPEETHHGWKYIAFGPDGKLYVPVGAPCNICESVDSIFNTITRINTDGTGLEIVQKGVRNTVGFDWQEGSNHLFFTDNGRDLMGDEVPECELNQATSDGQHFGYPYCHQGDVPDPEFGKKKSCDKFVKPLAKLGPHTAPLGMEFYNGATFPAQFHKQIFIARHGSWNRSKKSGYDVVCAYLKADGKLDRVEPFITGWLNMVKDEAWGRPVDFETLPDGSLLISDDYADCIYRVYFKG